MVNPLTQNTLPTPLNNTCEAYGCSQKATTKISVRVGQLGSILLDLCANCIEKFDEKSAGARQSQSQRLGVENNEFKELR
jgi:hypothetical protein